MMPFLHLMIARKLCGYTSSSRVQIQGPRCRAVVLSLPSAATFKTLPSVVMKPAPPNHIITSLLLPNCNFATVIDCNVNTWSTGYLICTPQRVKWYRLRNAKEETKKARTLAKALTGSEICTAHVWTSPL